MAPEAAGFRVVELYNVEGLLYGAIVIPPFAKPPIVVMWRGLVFLRLPRERKNMVRYREVTGYAIPDIQEMLPDANET